MRHELIYKKFEEYFPNYKNHVRLWVPNTDKTILITLKNRHEFIFLYDHEVNRKTKYYNRRKQKKGD